MTRAIYEDPASIPTEDPFIHTEVSVVFLSSLHLLICLVFTLVMTLQNSLRKGQSVRGKCSLRPKLYKIKYFYKIHPNFQSLSKSFPT
jgi:hypothetical protein